MKKQSLIPVIMISFLLSIAPRHLQASPDCDTVLNACDKVVQDQKSQIALRDLRITQEEKIMADQKETIKSQEDKLNSLFRNPWFFFTVGLVTGAYVARH